MCRIKLVHFVLSERETCATLDKATLEMLNSLLQQVLPTPSTVSSRLPSLGYPRQCHLAEQQPAESLCSLSIGLFTGRSAYQHRREIEPHSEKRKQSGTEEDEVEKESISHVDCSVTDERSCAARPGKRLCTSSSQTSSSS